MPGKWGAWWPSLRAFLNLSDPVQHAYRIFQPESLAAVDNLVFQMAVNSISYFVDPDHYIVTLGVPEAIFRFGLLRDCSSFYAPKIRRYKERSTDSHKDFPSRQVCDAISIRNGPKGYQYTVRPIEPYAFVYRIEKHCCEEAYTIFDIDCDKIYLLPLHVPAKVRSAVAMSNI